jgi:membrane peptidoglycan carboxypeptidase
VQTPIVVTRQVLTAAQDSQVQYAMEATTVDGTAVNAATGLGGRQIIGKTGTTSDEHSGFFIGAIPQYALVVGMFANEQNTANTKDSLALLGGGGFGGFWPATIWNTFAQAEFANLTAENFQNPQFSGQLWNMIGTLPKAKAKPKPKCTVTVHGKSFPVPGKGCPSSTPTPTPTTTQPTGFPTFPGQPTATPTTTVSGTPTSTATGTATATPTGAPTGFGHGGNTAEAATGVKAGMAVGGVLAALLPGSLLWTTGSRRRRKRGAGGSR